ncbi:hypothetical protein AeMF1_008574 [Aphanomyces euteiches]|nr:hypothetical protein AeMF1_008574 [Aphanomyces euteiches]
MYRAAIVSAAAAAVASAASATSQFHLGAVTKASHGCDGLALSFASSDNATSSYTVSYSDGTTTKTVKSTFSTFTNPSTGYVSPNLHTALFCDLTSGADYTYEVDGFTSSFSALLEAGSTEKSTVVAIVGDIGGTDWSNTTVHQIGRLHSHLKAQSLLIAGDWTYANGENIAWDNWFVEMEDVFADTPVLGITGNHETLTSGGNEYVKDTPPDHLKFVPENYIDYLARVVPLKLLLLAKLTTPDLKAVDRSVTPWVAVVKHNPYYNSWSNHQCQCSATRFEIDEADKDNCWHGLYYGGIKPSDPSFALREPHCGLEVKLEDLYYKYNVNVVFGGHVHAYERTAPIYKNKINNDKGTIHITIGAGGNFEGHAGPLLTPLSDWSLSSNNVTYGAGQLVATKSCFTWAWYADLDGNRTADDISAFDTFSLGDCARHSC